MLILDKGEKSIIGTVGVPVTFAIRPRTIYGGQDLSFTVRKGYPLPKRRRPLSPAREEECPCIR